MPKKKSQNAIRIRMYRTGFGDCYLLSFGTPARRRHVLIDFGVHMHGDIGVMDRVMDDIEKLTHKSLDLIIATHAHRDHISGFGQFAHRFANFDIGEVWMPWTDNPRDKKAFGLEKKQLALYDALDRHLRLSLAGNEDNVRYAAALDALSNLRGNETAKAELARAFGSGAKVRYLGAGASIQHVCSLSGLSAQVLGPPRDSSFFSRMDPPANQRYLVEGADRSSAVRPFPDLEIRESEEDFAAIRNDGQPLISPSEVLALKEASEASADRLALALDHVRNNTSLVVLFRFHGKSLLFPGDAQWGSWQSWIGTNEARRLLGEVDFLKLAHHGSENATPVDVVTALRQAGFAVMVSTQITPFPTIPRKPLLDAVEKRCLGHIAVRSDWVSVNGAPVPPKSPGRLPKGFKKGPLGIDYELEV